MKKTNMKRTTILAGIVFICGIFATQAFAHYDGNRYMGGGMMGYGGHMMNYDGNRGYGGNMMGYYGNGGGCGAYGGNMMGYGGHMMGYGNGGHMYDQLNSADRQKMFDQMDRFFDSTRDLRQQIYEKNIALEKEYAKDKVDEAKVESLQKELFNLNRKFEEKKFDHMTRMQKLYNDAYRNRG